MRYQEPNLNIIACSNEDIIITSGKQLEPDKTTTWEEVTKPW